MSDEREDVFPITKEEHDALYALGWNSGFGWERQFDWWHQPSMGDAIFLEDDEKWMTQWLCDLEGIRRDIWLKRLQTALADNAELVFEALRFARSVIKSGEPWTDECEEIIGGAIIKVQS